MTYPSDPATVYALGVRDGEHVVSRLVRLATERHLADLEHGAARGLVWNADEAEDACDFFPEVLCLPEDSEAEDLEDEADREPEDGTPFVLSPFQQFIIGSLFGWYAWRVSKTTGKRRLQTRFRVAYFEGAKGCGKTPMGAGILLYMLIRKRGAQLFCAAVGKDQAKLAFADCEKMVMASPALRALVDKKVNNLAVLSTGSFIRPISSEKRGLDGKRVQGAVIDELHEHPTEMVVAKVRAGTKGRPDALIFIPTNAGFDRESICWQYHEYSRQVLEGVVENDAWFAFVCHLDACEKCHAAGHYQPSDECPDCDDWQTEGPHWLKACPNLGVSVTWEYQREQVREAISLTSQRSLVRRLNFCQWMQQATVWIPPEAWAACKGSVSSASLVGRECFIGIDLSDKIDLTAVICVFPRPLERPTDPGGESGSGSAPIDRAIDVLSFFWMPKETLQRRANEDRIPYPEWERERYLTATTGPMVDHDAVVDFILNVLAKKYQVRGIGIDQAGASAVLTRLRREFGDDKDDADQRFVQEIRQGFRGMSDPSKTLEALVASRNLTHDGNRLMTWCISNMAIEPNDWREIRPIKIAPRKRIDGGVALIVAIAKMLTTPALEARWTGEVVAV